MTTPRMTLTDPKVTVRVNPKNSQQLLSEGYDTHLTTSFFFNLTMHSNAQNKKIAEEYFVPTESTRFIALDKEASTADISILLALIDMTDAKYFILAATQEQIAFLSQTLPKRDKHVETINSNNVQYSVLADLKEYKAALPSTITRVLLHDSFKTAAQEIADHQCDRLGPVSGTRLTEEQRAEKRKNRYGVDFKEKLACELQYKSKDKTICTITLTPPADHKTSIAQNSMVYLSNLFPDDDTLKNPVLLRDILIDAMEYAGQAFPGVKTVTLMAPGDNPLTKCLKTANQAYTQQTCKPLLQTLSQESQTALGIFPLFVYKKQKALREVVLPTDKKETKKGSIGFGSAFLFFGVAVVAGVVVSEIIKNNMRIR